VRITDGRSVARAGRARYAVREGQITLAAGVVVQMPEGTMRSRDATVQLGKGQQINTVTGTGGVQIEVGARSLKADRIFYDVVLGDVIASGAVKVVVPPDVVASGGQLTANIRTQVATFTGRARVQNPEWFIQGDRLDLDNRTQTAFVRDHVVAGFRKVQLSADLATLAVRDHKAVFRGHVQIKDPARIVTADQVTVYYQTGRVIAEGTTSVHIEEERP